jgi:hypothetical protein
MGKALAELLPTTPHRFVGDGDAALGQKQLNVSRAEAQHVIEPDGVAVDFSWEPTPAVGGG